MKELKNSRGLTDAERVQLVNPHRGAELPKRQLPLLLDDLREQHNCTMELVRELAERLTPVLNRVEGKPEHPPTPQMPLPPALDQLRLEIENVRAVNDMLGDLMNRLEV